MLQTQSTSTLKDKSIDPESRAIVRYALEINDPSLAELVRRPEAGEAIGDSLEFEETSETKNDDAHAEKIEALTQVICCAGDEPEKKSATLVLMETVESSQHPKALANTVKHLAFTHCGDSTCSG